MVMIGLRFSFERSGARVNNISARQVVPEFGSVSVSLRHYPEFTAVLDLVRKRQQLESAAEGFWEKR
jgi:hypothetical protein